MNLSIFSYKIFQLGGELKINGHKVTQWSRSLENGDVETIKYSANSSEPNANKWINDVDLRGKLSSEFSPLENWGSQQVFRLKSAC